MAKQLKTAPDTAAVLAPAPTSAAPQAPAAVTETSTPGASLFQGDEMSGATATIAKSPLLVWTAGRDLALVSAFANGAYTTAAIAKALASDPSFAGYPSEHLTAAKVRSRVNKLRKRATAQGEEFPLPVLDREPGAGRPASGPRPIDFAALRAVLAGSGGSETNATT